MFLSRFFMSGKFQFMYKCIDSFSCVVLWHPEILAGTVFSYRTTFHIFYMKTRTSNVYFTCDILTLELSAYLRGQVQ